MQQSEMARIDAEIAPILDAADAYIEFMSKSHVSTDRLRPVLSGYALHLLRLSWDDAASRARLLSHPERQDAPPARGSASSRADLTMAVYTILLNFGRAMMRWSRVIGDRGTYVMYLIQSKITPDRLTARQTGPEWYEVWKEINHQKVMSKNASFVVFDEVDMLLRVGIEIFGPLAKVQTRSHNHIVNAGDIEAATFNSFNDSLFNLVNFIFDENQEARQNRHLISHLKLFQVEVPQLHNRSPEVIGDARVRVTDHHQTQNLNGEPAHVGTPGPAKALDKSLREL